MYDYSGKHTVLMGDPFFFGIERPFSYNKYSAKVDRKLAIRQWHNLADALIDHGVQIFVIPPELDYPGLVYPSNAGFMANAHQYAPLLEKEFYFSNLLPDRAGEQFIYKLLLEGIGLRTSYLEKRFDGESDFFPMGKSYIFTHGKVMKVRYRFRFSFPPYEKIYNQFSDYNLLKTLYLIVGKAPIAPFTLNNNKFSHGDTVFCPFGLNREHLLINLYGLSRESQAFCLKNMGEQIILSYEDANTFVANSFQTIVNGEVILFIPMGTSNRLVDMVKERGVYPVLIDVSEFIKRGRGSIKCMINDLGTFLDSANDLSEKTKEYREKYRYNNYYNKI